MATSLQNPGHTNCYRTELLWVGVADGLEATIAARNNNPSGRSPRENYAAHSTGGFVSVPIGLAAAAFRVPYLLHQQTLSLGLVNRILAHVAIRIRLSSEVSLQHLPPRARRRAVVIGNPVRPTVLHGNPAKGLAAYGLDPAIPLVLVTSGASGAHRSTAC